MEKKIFILEAKIGPNKWVEVSNIYSRIEMESRYTNETDASLAKSKLKAALAGTWKATYKKKPIRISQLISE